MADEYIKRDAAINAVLLAKSDADITLVPGAFTNGFREGAKIRENAILNALADVPAADVREVVHARWLDGYRRQLCPICCYKGMRSWRFCPQCGAMMDADMRETEPQKCDACPQGAHWDSVVICGKDGQRHKRTDSCEDGEYAADHH